MSANVIDSKMLSKMFLSAAKNLESKKDYINELNVFPVPDGDTGTNMTLTIMSAANDVSSLENPDMMTLCKSISSGSLRGARGNSGVILSQLLRGFTKVVKEYDELDVAIISAGFDKAVETAYKAVMKPKEGTILTVAKAISTKANELFENEVDDLNAFLDGVIKYGYEVLNQTPDMLPVLKEAGVVDSGGQGLMEVMQGAYDAFIGKEIAFSMDEDTAKVASSTRKLITEEPKKEAEIKYGYCTEFIILLEGKTFNVKMENEFKDFLEKNGDSIVVVADGEVVKVHVHTNEPGYVIQRAISKYGQITNIKIDNMRLENKEKIEKEKTAYQNENLNADDTVDKSEKKVNGFISVSAGAGLTEIFKNLGVDYVIEGGQTMNPSTEDILNAIDKINAENVYVLPNNKNIIMAANQARDLTEDKNIIVIPTKTVPQGVSAMIGFVPEMTSEENETNMNEAISVVKTGQITYAVRNTTIEGKEIHEGDYMAIGDNGIIANGKDLNKVFTDMMGAMVDDTSELISIYYGSDVEEKDANFFKDLIANAYSSCDVDIQNGGQPVYYYIVSVE